MKKIYLVVVLFAVVFQTNAQILSVTRFVEDGKVQIEINKSTKKVKIVATCPKTGFMGLGFGATAMLNTYAIVFNSTLGDFHERKLAFHAEGTLLAPTFTLVKKDSTALDYIFTIEKTNVTTADYFDFNTVSSVNQLDGIASFGFAKKLAYHKLRVVFKYSFNETPLALNPTIEASKIVISPNPTTDKLNVAFPNIITDVNVIIYDFNATMIKEQNFKNVKEIEMSVNDLSSGNYIIQINGENLGHSYKFTKE